MPVPWHKRKDRVKAWEDRNREEGRLPYFMDRARSMNYRAKTKYRSKGTVTGQQLMDLYQSEKTCLYCGEELQPGTTHFDHMTPLARSGAHILKNLCCACGECNVGKNDSSAEDFIRQIEDTGEPDKAYAWLMAHKDEIEHRINEAKLTGIEEIDLEDFDLFDF